MVILEKSLGCGLRYLIHRPLSIGLEHMGGNLRIGIQSVKVTVEQEHGARYIPSLVGSKVRNEGSKIFRRRVIVKSEEGLT